MDGLGRRPLALELTPGMTEAGREGVGEIVIPRHRGYRRAERAQKGRRLLELLPAATVHQIATDNDQLRTRPLDQLRQAWAGDLAASRAEMKVGQV
jgi:hypothetical protein